MGVVLMGPHDIEREEGETVHCACGWSGTRAKHDVHFFIEKARAALKEGKTGA